jgi:Ni2+-binding GTPase involved in maturation of urease and hydrogenase
MLEDFKGSLLSYLFKEKALAEKEIEAIKNMTTEERIENNLLLPNVSIVDSNDGTYKLNVPNNYSKLRIGDRVKIFSDSKKHKATIVDIYQDNFIIECNANLDEDLIYNIEIDSPNLIQSLIACLEDISAGKPGANFLRILSGSEPLEIEDFLALDPIQINGFSNVYSRLNEEQQNAVKSMLRFPTIHILQGPPGTGKTQVLAATAIATAIKNREVVIIANTHHAVNNALMKVRSFCKNSTIIKVGDLLKNEDLDETIIKFSKFSEYNEWSYSTRKNKKSGHIIGMTIWGAITYLGLHRHSHYRPYIALVDEASLMGLSYASILGKCASSICLFGDSRQMQPIYRLGLESDEHSVSIMDYCSDNVDNIPISILHTTYRMNEEITSAVSKSFYEPYGIKLISSDYSRNNSLKFKDIEVSSIKKIVVESDNCHENNAEEAHIVANEIKYLLDKGVSPRDIAVITPFRKQVNEIRDAIRNSSNIENLLVDTVERLQGQDVDVIILSFATSSSTYMECIQSFLFNPNRLNVMISRAKKQVIIVASPIVMRNLDLIIKY